jgi:hypothetical protein
MERHPRPQPHKSCIGDRGEPEAVARFGYALAVVPSGVGPAITSDGDCVSLGRERTLLNAVVRFAEDDLVDLVQGEAGDLDRSVGQDQLLELNLQLVEVPLAFLPKAIGGEAQHALVLLAYTRS